LIVCQTSIDLPSLHCIYRHSSLVIIAMEHNLGNITNNYRMQAAESLSMNGRALNDRAIEVSPSSSRVLDRAAGSQPPGGPPLLTPFPPSKNRPRPGDWTCPSCGFSNFQRRTACFRCSFPAMGASQPDPYNQGYGMPQHHYGQQQQGYGHPGMMSNHGGHGHGHNHGHGGYGGMGGHVGGGGSGGGRGGSVPFRAGDWQCGNEGCKYHNFAKNTSCLRCGASRSQAAIIAEGGMTNFPGNNSNNYGPPPNMGSSMGGQSYGGMNHEGGQYGGSAMGGPPGNFGGQSYGPPSTYALPSGIGAQPSPYGGYSQMGSNGGMQQQHQSQQQQQQQGGFDSRAEQAFNQGNSSAAGGAPGYSNGSYAGGASGYGGNDSTPGAGDPFSFLSSGMGNLGIDERRNNGQGAAGATKSPQ
jgi:hypothetical protein